MISITKLISTAIEEGIRIVKVFRLGRSDVRSGIQAAPFGIDSNPVKDMTAIYADGQVKGQQTIIGYINLSNIAGVGETRLYSTNTAGDVQIDLILKHDGTMEIGGNSDFMVRYSKLEDAFNELQNKFNTFANAYAPGSPSTLGTPPSVSPSTGDISLAKITEIKTS